MNLYPSKDNVISFTRRHSRINFMYKVGETVISRAYEILNLEILLTEKMDMNSHVNFIVAKTLSVVGKTVKV